MTVDEAFKQDQVLVTLDGRDGGPDNVSPLAVLEYKGVRYLSDSVEVFFLKDGKGVSDHQLTAEVMKLTEWIPYTTIEDVWQEILDKK